MSDKEADFAFWYGEIVRLREDHPDDDLMAGDAGYVWCVCGPSFSCYEADFYRKDGTGIARPFTPDEVELVEDPASVCIPEDVHEFWRREARRNAAA